MDRSIVHDVHMAINLVHRFVYFVPEAAEEYAALGVPGRGSYFASRSAPMGAVTDQTVIATFYNFSPRAIVEAMPGVWDAASPDQWQAARFRVAGRALQRVNIDVSVDQIAEARSLIDPVVAGLPLAGRPLAAGNAAVTPPNDALLALWQQVTVLREWRGDVHIAVLVTNEIDPCECLYLQVGTGRFPLRTAQATRRWTEDEWTSASRRLAQRGWVADDGSVSAVGVDERERIEDETDRLCESIWQPIGDVGAERLAQLITPIHAAMDAAGTYVALT
jgi:hypothetical protein